MDPSVADERLLAFRLPVSNELLREEERHQKAGGPLLRAIQAEKSLAGQRRRKGNGGQGRD